MLSSGTSNPFDPACDYLNIKMLQTVHYITPIKIGQRTGPRACAEMLAQAWRLLQVAEGGCERRPVERTSNARHVIARRKIGEIAIRIEHYRAPGSAILAELSGPTAEIINGRRKRADKDIT